VLSGAAGQATFDDDSDEDDSRGRLDINYINELDDDEDYENLPMDIKGKLPYRPRRDGLLPYRVHRIEHEERVVSVNMESSSSRSAELRKKAEAEKAAEKGETTLVEEEEEDAELRVKDEPVDDNDAPMVDALPHVEDDGFLPAQNVRVRRKVPPSPQKPKPRRTEPISLEPEQLKRDPRELLRTKEEIDEYDRHLEDLDYVRNLLFYEPPEKPDTPIETTPAETQTAAVEAEPATAAQDEAEEGEKEDEEDEEDKLTNPKLLGQLFLMQFPPMTPNLTVPGSLTTVPASTPAPAPTAPGEVKTEDDVQVVDADAPGNETPAVITAGQDWALPAGRAGKLNVHKSGRVTMDWGGISFELDRAAAVDFVQEALIVSAPEPDVPGAPPKDETEQRAWSMGQLSGKFTVMPNWDQML
jgi:DNA-directed RNA polymerase III subunit RPC4